MAESSAEAHVDSRPGWQPVACAVFVFAAAVAHAASYLPFLADDALISLRYARRFLDGSGLTWTDGERVEGYSNLLWVVLTAGLGRLGLDLIAAARLLGFLSTAATLGALAWAQRGLWRSHPWLAAAPCLLLAATGSLAVWTVGGLETPLTAALLAWGVVCCFPLAGTDEVRSRRAVVPGLFLGLLCLTRPDGFLLAAALAAGVWLARRLSRVGDGDASAEPARGSEGRRTQARTGRAAGSSRSRGGHEWRLPALILGVPVLMILAQLGFRLAYYGEWLPNTAHAKLTFSAQHLRSGLRYVLLGFVALLGLLLPALWSLRLALSDPRRRSRAVLLALPLALWALYIVAIGGDIFPARRHMLPAAVLLALLAGETTRWIADQDARARRRGGWLMAAALALVLIVQLADPQNRRAHEERWEWDGQVVGLTLKRAFGAQKPLLAVDPAGCVPYFSGLPSLDMLGLNDRHIARSRPPASFGSRLAHEVGDGGYVLERNPDLVLFSQPAGGAPDYPTGRMMVADPRFHTRYREILVEGREPYQFRFQIYVKRVGGPLGIFRTPECVQIPGYLFADAPGNVARLTEGREGHGIRLGMTIPPGATAELDSLCLEPGVWRASAELEGGTPRLFLTRHIARAPDGAAGGDPLAEGASPLTLELGGESGACIDVAVGSSGGGQAILVGVTLERVASRRE